MKNSYQPYASNLESPQINLKKLDFKNRSFSYEINDSAESKKNKKSKVSRHNTQVESIKNNSNSYNEESDKVIERKVVNNKVVKEPINWNAKMNNYSKKPIMNKIVENDEPDDDI